VTEDQKLSVLFGEQVEMEEVGHLYFMNLRAIRKFGVDEYNRNISMLCMDEIDIHEMFNYELEEDIEPYDFLLQNALFGDENVKREIFEAFEMILRQPISVNELGFFYAGALEDNRIITKEVFEKMVEIIKYQSFIQKDNSKIKPKNEEQKKYFQRLKKVKELRREREGEPESELLQIVSSITAIHPNYDFSNIQNLTMFQLIDQYKRLCSAEEYNLNIQALLHGATNENLKIKHWSEPMQ
jgi:hypothetical protein